MAYFPRVALSARLASRAVVPVTARLTPAASIASRNFHSGVPKMSQHPIATLQVRTK
jgi:cyanate lyase